MALCIAVSLPFSKPISAGSTFHAIVYKATSYAPSVTYTLNVIIDGGGSVSLNATGPYNDGDVVYLIAYPNYGWSFLTWSGDLNGSNNPVNLVMDSDKVVTAHFVLSNTLYLTVQTDKYLYKVQDTVNVSGSFFWEPTHIPVTDALIGIEVRTPNGSPFVLRTMPTGPISGQSWVVNFTRLFTCDQNQVPKSTFLQGEDVWIFTEWKNFDLIHDHTVTMTTVFYDLNSAPLYLDFSSGNLIPNGVSSNFFQGNTAYRCGREFCYLWKSVFWLS